MDIYRQATREELDLAVRWAAAEGWNPGQGDADIYWEADPQGFVCVERAGEMIASGSIVSYAGQFGFMGFFIVRPDLRHQGIGGPFWRWRKETLRERLGPEAAIGMDGVFTMVDFYAKGGFVSSHRHLRMEGVGKAASLDASVVPLREIPFAAVAAYDETCFGVARETFLRRWITRPNGWALGYRRGEQLAGYGVIRPAHTGYRIGPLFADDADVAEALYTALCANVAGEATCIDLPDNNPAALALAERHHLNEVFGCARMYVGEPPQVPHAKIYGVTTLELG